MEKNKIKNLTLSAMFLALAFVLPFLTGQIQQIGSMLCPMHIPVLLCGFFCGGLLYNKLPKRKIYVYISLINAMIIGRLVWGLVMFGCMGFDISKFGLSAFLAGAVLNAVPGIIIQIILVPIVVIALEKI